MSARRPATADDSVLVIGLGRFGVAVATSLVRMGYEVLAVDADPELVQKWAPELTHTVQADSTDGEVLRQLGVSGFGRAVVAIGDDVESSLLTVVGLVEEGVPQIWAQAITRKHGKILQSVGAHHIVNPERAMGERIAHVVTGRMSDYIAFEDGFAIARARAPAPAWDHTLGESRLRTTYGVTVVGVKRPGQDFTYAVPETSVLRGDELIVSGPADKVDQFCGLRDVH